MGPAHSDLGSPAVPCSTWAIPFCGTGRRDPDCTVRTQDKADTQASKHGFYPVHGLGTMLKLRDRPSHPPTLAAVLQHVPGKTDKPQYLGELPGKYIISPPEPAQDHLLTGTLLCFPPTPALSPFCWVPVVPCDSLCDIMMTDLCFWLGDPGSSRAGHS